MRLAFNSFSLLTAATIGTSSNKSENCIFIPPLYLRIL